MWNQEGALDRDDFNLSKSFFFSYFLAWVLSIWGIMSACERAGGIHMIPISWTPWESPLRGSPLPPSGHPMPSIASVISYQLPYSPVEIPLAAGCSLPQRDFYRTVRRGTCSAGRNRDTTWIPLPISWPLRPWKPTSTIHPGGSSHPNVTSRQTNEVSRCQKMTLCHKLSGKSPNCVS